MIDPATVSAALESIKIATTIAKFLRDTASSLEKAEVKLKLADLMDSLADTRIRLADLQEELIEKDKLIAELRKAFETKDTLVRYEDAYYERSEAGGPSGTPFCLNCWEAANKKRQLVSVAGNRDLKTCTDCKQEYSGSLTRYIGRPPQFG